MNRFIIILLSTLLVMPVTEAQIINANPGNYTTLLSTLTPGDTLLMEAGTYYDRLNINNMNGTASQPIVIMGSGNSTVFTSDACCNTVSIRKSSFITLRDFKIDGQGLAVDGVKAEGTAGNWAHHIVLDNLLIIGHGANQQTVGISTKCPAWDWVIRGCTINRAGTGIYLGNSNGEEPFVNSIIENNLIKNTIGYNLQIKHQNEGSRDEPGMTLNGKTLIRHNVFSKDSNASSGNNARPNMLLGNFPSTGDGANDHYEVYGNFFWQNPTESLFQGTGNIAFYDNVCVNSSGGNGITFQDHNGFEPRDIRVFHNTVVCDISWGFRLMNTDPDYQKYVYGNAVFSDHGTPIRVVGGGASTVNLEDNITDATGNANNYVNNASSDIATIDLYPKTGSDLNATLIPNDLFMSYTDYSNDFNSDQRSWHYRGAYSGEGTNSGWHLALEKKMIQDTMSTSIKDITSFTDRVEVKLFPNPVDGNAFLHFDKQMSNIALSISDIDGRVIYREDFSQVQDIGLNTSALVANVYFITIKTQDDIMALKMIKR